MCIDPFVTLSSDGKTMMKKGTQGFSHAASAVYATISQEEKEELQKRCTSTAQSLTAKDIKQNGKKIFKAIDRHVRCSRLAPA